MPPETEIDEDPCDICESGGEECMSCEATADYEDCYTCGGSGFRIPDHCCDCGGSPYCDCCKTCKQCVATCKCPVNVAMSDGSTLTLGPAREEKADV